MPQRCSACAHPDRQSIDRELVAGEPLRNVAERTGTSATALHRHKAEHLPIHLVKAQAAAEVAAADDLLTQLRDLQGTALRLLSTAEQAGDLRAALMGVAQARSCLELLAKLLGELDDRPTTNILIAPEWVALRSEILSALQPFPEARQAVAERLAALEAR